MLCAKPVTLSDAQSYLAIPNGSRSMAENKGQVEARRSLAAGDLQGVRRLNPHTSPLVVP